MALITRLIHRSPLFYLIKLPSYASDTTSEKEKKTIKYLVIRTIIVITYFLMNGSRVIIYSLEINVGVSRKFLNKNQLNVR